MTPLAWSDEPWQIATVFETVLLSEGGPALYAQLASTSGWPAWHDARVVTALKRLRWLRDLDDEPTTEQPWTASARRLQSGAAGMLIMGDWARGELEAWGEQPGLDFDCVPIPQTAGMHLYSIDTLAMLVRTRNAHRAEQERMAEVLAQPATQMAYNQAKGSVPVRMDIDPAQLDVCARGFMADAHPSRQRITAQHRAPHGGGGRVRAGRDGRRAASASSRAAP